MGKNQIKEYPTGYRFQNLFVSCVYTTKYKTSFESHILPDGTKPKNPKQVKELAEKVRTLVENEVGEQVFSFTLLSFTEISDEK